MGADQHRRSFPHDPATAYVAATRYKLDDYNPYLYKTTDYGQNWQRLDANFPSFADSPQITRVIRADPAQPGLLYVGTETGLYLSLDDGVTWQRLESNLPVAPVYDLVVKGDDLVVATHGRAFWILDDLTPLRLLAGAQAEASTANLYLFPPRPTVRQNLGWNAESPRSEGKNYGLGLGATVTFTEAKGPNGELVRKFLDAGENPPNGVITYYNLPDSLSDSDPSSLSLTFMDEAGAEIRSFTGKPADSAEAKPKNDLAIGDERFAPAKPGLNRFVWDLRYPNATKVPGDLTTEKAVTGPKAAPGFYQVRLTLGDQSALECFTLRADPRVAATAADLQAQFALGLQIRDKITQVQEAINQLRRIRQQVMEWGKRAQAMENQAEIVHGAEELQNALTAVETELIQTEVKSGTDRLRLKSRLNAKLIALLSVISAADAAPTKQTYTVFEHLSDQVDDQMAALHNLMTEDVPSFNELVREANLPPVWIE